VELTQIMLIPLIIATIGIFYSLPQLFLEIKKLKIKRKYLLLLFLISFFFFLFEIFYVKPTERIFFDEHLYQDEAINIIKQFNAKMCVYGTSDNCKILTYYHQGIAWAYIIALSYLIFGINVMHSAWNLNLIFSTFSIPILFFITFLLTKKESTSILATFFYSLTPLTLIWARTGCAEVSLVFFSLLSILSLLLWLQTKNKKIFIFLLSSLTFAAQAKIEGVFILAIIFAFYILLSNFKLEEFLEFFIYLFFLLFPAFVYLLIQYQQDSFGQTQNIKFSINYFVENIVTNSLFWFNYYQNGTPIQTQNVNNLFLPIFAIFSIFAIKEKELRRKVLCIGIWFIVPFLLYASFYAGSVTYGVDNRFMLSCVAPLSILGAIGISKIYSLFSFSKISKIFGVFIFSILILVYVYEFLLLSPYVVVDPMQIWEAHDARVYVFDFVLKHYNDFPKDCYFVSYVPGLFRALGRNGIYTETFFGLYSSGELKGKCLVFDYGYWCIVPPFHDTTCKAILQRFQTKMVENLTLPDNRTLAFYYILNSTK
jgi:4-amino-4-deoxy-L-arabinose transferase-like glycosyltransferase